MRPSVAALAAWLVLCPLAAAEGVPDGSYEGGEVVFLGDTPVPVRSRFAPAPGGGETRIRVELPAGPVETRREGALLVSADTNDQGVFVAAVASSPPAVVTWFVRATDAGHEAPPMGVPTRLAGRERVPVNVTVARTPTGFTVIFQEASAFDPNDAWTTYVARFDPLGRPLGPADAMPSVPWPIADVAWFDGAYFFLLWYAASPGSVRLAAVHVDEAGQPREHPWWASRASMIHEAHLVARGDRMLAVYRGGPSGAHLLEADVTSGAWAREAPEPRALGSIGAEETFGARWDGRAVVVERDR